MADILDPITKAASQVFPTVAKPRLTDATQSRDITTRYALAQSNLAGAASAFDTVAAVRKTQAALDAQNVQTKRSNFELSRLQAAAAKEQDTDLVIGEVMDTMSKLDMRTPDGREKFATVLANPDIAADPRMAPLLRYKSAELDRVNAEEDRRRQNVDYLTKFTSSSGIPITSDELDSVTDDNGNVNPEKLGSLVARHVKTNKDADDARETAFRAGKATSEAASAARAEALKLYDDDVDVVDAPSIDRLNTLQKVRTDTTRDLMTSLGATNTTALDEAIAKAPQLTPDQFAAQLAATIPRKTIDYANFQDGGNPPTTPLLKASRGLWNTLHRKAAATTPPPTTPPSTTPPPATPTPTTAKGILNKNRSR